ncbi:uncharacterized protein BYT42DRAFT_575054 [Radiomyces spectabilis]|uniref:uncharacterized protein n=1 Tax=Radiomyces spectabilis TaxID=64574 RepID=UPI002220AC64|nr:uncharacterized protein BYT42DRAFT_575054 [Radiomyces spectabilis]KAI8376561.1 hypothetical protein BYT42DRAFT_575054 [Radiomyces spectabilis]
MSSTTDEPWKQSESNTSASQSTPSLPPPPIPFTNDVKFTTVPPTLPTRIVDESEDDRLTRAGLAPKPRVILLTAVGSFWGFGIGSFLGGRQAGLQYLAENAHRLPTTVQGWYFYHKAKNYRMMLGGVKRGIRFAGKTGGLCLLYGALEASLDDLRGEADVVNSVTAGVSAGALFSALTKLTRGSFRYSILFGATFGLAAGGLSDIHRYVSGQPPSYVQWLRSKF